MNVAELERAEDTILRLYLLTGWQDFLECLKVIVRVRERLT